ncbi:hypothetical protein [Thermococcus profundus]|uniref:hypothetical protein n=1 Tax=Thermococcus profundus TaxID=49899 RepID=UPI0012FD9F05|nr:hypothetical protein [Thermococcus profundus]
MRILILATISLSAGFIGSLMSGGSIVIFFLLTFLGIPVQSAVGSALTYYRGGAIEVRTALYLITFSVPGAVGAVISSRLSLWNRPVLCRWLCSLWDCISRSHRTRR